MKTCSAVLMTLCACAASETYAQNGGTTCATATTIASGATLEADTTAAPNWMSSFGPLVSPSNDVAYTFTPAADFPTTLTPTAADYAFAMYLIPSCNDSGTEPVPIAATATLGIPINVSGLVPGHQYYLAVTGTAAGGAGANGHLTIVQPLGPVALQSFEVD